MKAASPSLDMTKSVYRFVINGYNMQDEQMIAGPVCLLLRLGTPGNRVRSGLAVKGGSTAGEVRDEPDGEIISN